MERSFPRNTRRHVPRTLAVLCTVAVATAPALLPGANADDLRDKQKKAQHDAASARGDLEDSSKALAAAATKLSAARAQLGVAQRELAKTEGQLTAARVLDTQMQAKLAQAEQALADAQAELAAGVQAVKDQRAAIGRMVATNYQNGDPRLLGLSMILSAQDPAALASQLGAVDSVMDKQSADYDRLKATEAMLRTQAKKVQAAKAAVAEQRQAAAVNLAHKQALEKAAVAKRARVASLVSARQTAARAARLARAADARRLRQAKKEEARIKRLILERAKHQKGGYKGANDGFLLRPVANSYITSPYGWRRHPIYGYWGLHNGDDFHAPCGTPELASASGTVVSEYYSDVWGNRLFLDVGRVNGKNMTLVYNHISSYKVGTGRKVGRGDVVAYAGTTGWSTGCHLHFTVLIDGTAVNPENYF